MSLPIIAIVGRPNVGKSSLLNALAGRRISIVDATPGVTRDRVSVPLALGEGDNMRWVDLIDTGGMGIEDVDKLTDHVESQIRYAIEAAAVVLFVVDAREGLTPLDRHVAEQLRKMDRPVILLANKVDQPDAMYEQAELFRLGFGEPLDISATHRNNLDELTERLEAIVAELPPAPPVEPTLQLAIVGKRNAGKSTLINALAGEARVIVSETPGTTRDSVDVRVQIGEQTLVLIDTAGLRKKRKLANDVEFYSQHRAMRSVRRADVVAMVIDASLPVSQVDKALAGVIAEEYKPVMIIVNKWDLARESATMEDYAEYFTRSFPELAFAPISFTVASEGVNVRETLALADQLFRQAQTRVTTGQLNAAIGEILSERGPSHRSGTRPPKLYYASQIDVAPPTIVCFVNDVRSFDQRYERFLINRLREYLPFPEVPIRLMFRQRRREERRS